MAKKFLDYSGLERFLDKVKVWATELFATKDVASTTSSGLMSAEDKKNLDELPTTNISSTATNNGVKVSLGGTIGEPTISVETTVGGVSANNTGIVSGADVKSYVDNNAASTATFKAATSSSIAVNGLVPAPSSANTSKYLRGDGTWATPTNTTYSAGSGLALSGTSFSLKTGYTTSGKNYAVKVDSNGNPYVNVPWTDNNTTYGLATSTSNGLMSSAMAAMIYPNPWSGAKAFGDNKHENSIYMYGKGSTFYFVSSQKNSEGNAIVYTMINDGNIGNYKAGSASVAEKIGTSDVGNETKPIYLSKGSAKSCTYELNKSVPSDAVFTDTHYTAKNIVSNSASATANVAATNGNVHINLVENNTCRSGIKIVGSGATTVSSDANGNITILSSDTNTTYGLATSTSNGLMSSAMASINDGENINLTNGGAIKFGQSTSQDWTMASGEGLKILQAVNKSSTNAPSNYAVGLQVSGYYSFIFGQIAGTANNFVGRTGNNYDWVYFIHSGNIENYKAGSASSADSATNVSGASATADAARHVWFSDSATETKRSYDDDFTYNPSTNTLTCSATQWNGYNLSVVTSKPSNPDSNTIYFVRS